MIIGQLATVEYECLELDLGELIDQVAVFTTVRPTTALQLRDLLLSGTIARQARGRLWRGLIARAEEREEGIVAAVGMAMPALKVSARRLGGGLDPHQAQDIQEKMLLAFVAGVRTTGTTWNACPGRCAAAPTVLGSALARMPSPSTPSPRNPSRTLLPLGIRTRS